jgi:site-specific recombinase XerD
MAKVPKRLPQILTREEVARLFAHCRDVRSRTLLMTKYAAGLRLSEVCALHRVSHIEYARCPHCSSGQFRVVAVIQPQRRLPHPRGPP